MAARLGLHNGFGPSPLVEMLLNEMALLARDAQRFLSMKNPLPQSSWNLLPSSPALDTWHLNLDNPNWENNVEATTSSGTKMPRLQLIRNTSPSEELSKEIVVYNQEFA